MNFTIIIITLIHYTRDIYQINDFMMHYAQLNNASECETWNLNRMS